MCFVSYRQVHFYSRKPAAHVNQEPVRDDNLPACGGVVYYVVGTGRGSGRLRGCDRGCNDNDTYPIIATTKLIMIILELIGEVPTDPYDAGGMKSASAVAAIIDPPRVVVQRAGGGDGGERGEKGSQ